jgi:hypothetical protein
MDLSNSLQISSINGSNRIKTKKELFTTGNGKTPKNAAEENKFGEMDQFIKESSTITWPTAKADSFILVEMSMKVNGSTTKPKEKVFTYMQMDPCTLGNG